MTDPKSTATPTWAAVALVATVVAAALTVTPAQHDFGKAGINGVVDELFHITSVPGDTFQISLTGRDPVDFRLTNTSPFTCTTQSGSTRPACDILIGFRPKSLGIKTASFVVINKAGQRATATLTGEGVKADCVQVHVHCNYVHIYTGTIQIQIVDTVMQQDHVVRYATDINMNVAPDGVVTCSGSRSENEKLGYKGVFHTELKANGPIAGTGMLAVEYQQDQAGKWTYVLTYACPTPRFTRTSTDLRSGNSETENVPSNPADWRESERLADPQSINTGPPLPLLKGQHTNTRWDRDNQEGGYTKANWDLKLAPPPP
jgi:hypothetical protein